MKIVVRRFAKSFVVMSLAFAGACNSSSDGNNGGGGNGGGGDGGNGAGSGGQMSEGGSSSGGTAGSNTGGNASGGSTASGGAGGMGNGGAGGSAGGAGGMQTGGAGGMQLGGAGGMQTAGASGNPSFGGALFLAVGQGKTALTADGKVWTSYSDGMTPNQLEILGACISDNVVVAVNHGGAAGAKQGVWTSTNGHNFVMTFEGLPGEDCAAGKGLISAGNRYTLDHGKTWLDATSNGGVGNRGVAFGNNVFVGAGDNNLDWSADGKTWSKGTVVGGGGVTGMSHVYFGGNKFIALPYDNKNPAYESTDGKMWTKTKTALPAGSNSSNGGAAVKKIFVVTSAGIYWLSDSSAPGTEAWTKSLSSFDDGAIGGNDAIAVSAKHWSTDGMTWSLSTTPVLKDFGITRILKLTP